MMDKRGGVMSSGVCRNDGREGRGDVKQGVQE